jgi:hypothetical protein
MEIKNHGPSIRNGWQGLAGMWLAANGMVKDHKNNIYHGHPITQKVFDSFPCTGWHYGFLLLAGRWQAIPAK